MLLRPLLLLLPPLPYLRVRSRSRSTTREVPRSSAPLTTPDGGDCPLAGCVSFTTPFPVSSISRLSHGDGDGDGDFDARPLLRRDSLLFEFVFEFVRSVVSLTTLPTPRSARSSDDDEYTAPLASFMSASRSSEPS